MLLASLQVVSCLVELNFSYRVGQGREDNSNHEGLVLHSLQVKVVPSVLRYTLTCGIVNTCFCIYDIGIRATELVESIV